jgi:hypothetical protein
MDFLNSEFDFKAVSRAVERYLKDRRSPAPIATAELLHVLLPVARLTGGDQLLAGASRLAARLNASKRAAPQQPELQQMLSIAFTSGPYQRLHARLRNPTEFRLIFDDIKVAPCHLEKDEKIEHPFPKALRRISSLSAWREAWERNAFSTKAKPFFPPMLPSSYFEGRAARYEYRRDWVEHSVARRQERSNGSNNLPILANGRCCVLVRDKSNHLIGAASWFWWGLSDLVSGVGYSLAVHHGSEWFHTYFDIRPDRFEPTYGPDIHRECQLNPRSFIKLCLDELVELGPRFCADELSG